jgi:hypothetical protein
VEDRQDAVGVVNHLESINEYIFTFNISSQALALAWKFL